MRHGVARAERGRTRHARAPIADAQASVQKRHADRSVTAARRVSGARAGAEFEMPRRAAGWCRSATGPIRAARATRRAHRARGRRRRRAAATRPRSARTRRSRSGAGVDVRAQLEDVRGSFASDAPPVGSRLPGSNVSSFQQIRVRRRATCHHDASCAVAVDSTPRVMRVHHVGEHDRLAGPTAAPGCAGRRSG